MDRGLDSLQAEALARKAFKLENMRYIRSSLVRCSDLNWK